MAPGPKSATASSAATPVTSPPPETAGAVGAAEDAAPAIGIDLGSEYCCVAYCKDGRGEVIANEDGERSTPSVIAFDSEERFAGTAAKAQLARNRANTVTDFKSMLGKKYDEVAPHAKKWAFKTMPNASGDLVIQVEHKDQPVELTPEEIVGIMLERMRDTASAYLGVKVTQAVVTVPQHFTPAQRASLRAAAKHAGLNILRLLSEPVAAALAFNADRNDEADHLIAVVDVGATLNLTVILASNGIYRVLAHTHEPTVGGREFDDKLVQHFAAEFKRKTKFDLKESERALTKLRLASEQTKRSLSQSATAPISIESLHEGEDLRSTINRSMFDSITAPLTARIVAAVEDVLSKAAVTKAEIDQVILAGGMAANSKVQAVVAALFDGTEVKVDTFPDETAAVGAAIEAGLLLDDGDTADIEGDFQAETLPESLGVADADGKFVRLIRAGAPLPARRTRAMAYGAGQGSVVVSLYAGDAAVAADNRLVAQARLTDLAPAGGQVGLVLQMNASGEATLSIQDKTTRAAARVFVGVAN